MQAIRDERDKLLIGLDKLDTDLKVARDIISSALALLAKPQRLYMAMTDSQRKLTQRAHVHQDHRRRPREDVPLGVNFGCVLRADCILHSG
jgi:hypothetical protein